MSQSPAMPLFPDAYLADTMDLSLEEHGAYLKLLMITWRNNGEPLPDDDARIARMLGVTAARWKTKLRPVLARFFDLSEGTWRQKRLEKEWRYVIESKEKQRDKAKARWNGNGLKNNNPDDAAASRRHMPEGGGGTCPHTHTHTLDSPSPPVGGDSPRGDERGPESEAARRLPPGDRGPSPQGQRTAQSRGRGRGAMTPIPPDWSPTLDDLALAMQQGHPDPSAATDRFRNHHLGKGTKAADWGALWRNWVAEDIERGWGHAAPGSTGHRGGKAAVPAPSDDDVQWRARVKGYADTGLWPPMAPGEPPGHAGCQAPAHILREFGFDYVTKRDRSAG